MVRRLELISVGRSGEGLKESPSSLARGEFQETRIHRQERLCRRLAFLCVLYEEPLIVFLHLAASSMALPGYVLTILTYISYQQQQQPKDGGREIC